MTDLAYRRLYEGAYADLSYDKLREMCAEHGWSTDHKPPRSAMIDALRTVAAKRNQPQPERHDMESNIKQDHRLDANGNPAGGITEGRGFVIGWQNGPLVNPETGERMEPTGAFVEDVIKAAIGRIEAYQRTQFACPENAAALAYLRNALSALNERTRAREAQGVEGTHEVHEARMHTPTTDDMPLAGADPAHVDPEEA